MPCWRVSSVSAAGVYVASLRSGDTDLRGFAHYSTTAVPQWHYSWASISIETFVAVLHAPLMEAIGMAIGEELRRERLASV